MSSSKPVVLVVDDSATIRACIRKFLGDEFIVRTASHGEQGWQMLHDDETVSLVFVDMNMPGLNGMLLLQRIRQSEHEHIANMPVIMITGIEDSEAAKRACHTIGASDFISKPFDRDEILRHAHKFTRLSRRIAEFCKDPKGNALAGLDNHRHLIDFGNKAVAFALQHAADVSILYAEIPQLRALRERHSSHVTEQIANTIHELLASSLREDELVTRIDDGRFVIVLPVTKAFIAQIVAARLKKAVRKVEFEIAGERLRVALAVGLSSTDNAADRRNSRFRDYCVQAALALRTSLDTAKYPVMRFDDLHQKSPQNSAVKVHVSEAADSEVNDDAMEEFGEFFTSILLGDYSAIPQSYITTLVDPLQKFLDHARPASERSTHKKAS